MVSLLDYLVVAVAADFGFLAVVVAADIGFLAVVVAAVEIHPREYILVVVAAAETETDFLGVVAAVEIDQWDNNHPAAVYEHYDVRWRNGRLDRAVAAGWFSPKKSSPFCFQGRGRMI